MTSSSSWKFPLKLWQGEIPTGSHPGAFASRRKYDIHCGVDLYVQDNEPVYAVEDGTIVAIEEYTGPSAESPWWLPTQAILVAGKSGVVCYGEVKPVADLLEGGRVKQGEHIAHVYPVLKEGKVRDDIPGHSRFMLHFELYEHGTTESVWWLSNQQKPANLLNPTGLLIDALKRD